MWFEDASMARVVEVLDEIGRLLVEPKSLREAMPLALRADALMGRVVRWLRRSPTEDEVQRTRDEVLVLLNEVVAMVGSTSSAS
jgi:DNA-directed RNA polymerase subunit H (RpoH/RPB5)